MKKIKHGILFKADIGSCPSCKELLALPALMDLDKLQICPKCHAASYGYKWQADKGKTAVNNLHRLGVQ